MIVSPRVSVIIPAYHAEAWVGDAVSSALSQTLNDIEVLLIDDGSRDATVTAAEHAGAGDPRLRILKLPTNRGVSVARNTALAVARGEWVAPLDADDTMDPQRLERLVSVAQERGADILADNLVVQRVSLDEPPSLAFPHCRMERTAPIDAAEYVATDRPGWGTRASGFIHPIIRRAVIEEHHVRYDPELSHGEDFHFIVRLLLRGARLHYVDEAYYRYKIFDNSLSRAGWERILRSFRRCCMLLREEATTRGASRVARELNRREHEMDAWIAYRDLTQALRGRRLLEAQRMFWRMPSRSYAIGRFAASARRRVGLAERPV